MEARAVVQLKSQGQVVLNSTTDHYWEYHHSGLLTEIADFFYETGKFIASQFGYGSGDFKSVTESLEKIVQHSDKQFLGKAAVAVVGSNKFDEIEILLEVWSEDDLKGDTCKVAMHDTAAQDRGENLGPTNYQARFVIKTANLQTGVYKFVWGGQDVGWHEDVAFLGQLEIVYDCGPLLPLTNLPAHQVPNVDVADQIAHDYATLNTLIAEFGIDLGNKNKNSSRPDDHYTWARKQKLPTIVAETVLKIQILAGQAEIFPYAYALLSAELPKIWGARPADNEALDHYHYAYNLIQRENTVSRVRDELLRKIFEAFERPIAFTIPAELVWPKIPEVDLQRMKTELATRAKAMETVRGLKRFDPRPQPPNLTGEFSIVRDLQIGNDMVHIPEHRIRRIMGGV